MSRSLNHILKPKFIVKATSNTDIMNWIKYLKIPHFKLGVFSRNTLHGIPKEGESMVINLDHSSKGGTHWFACYVKQKTDRIP